MDQLLGSRPGETQDLMARLSDHSVASWGCNETGSFVELAGYRNSQRLEVESDLNFLGQKQGLQG